MELRHLKYFLTLAEELHFSRAADKLYISQPPLSRMIKSLEIELGVDLFERNKRNVKLTEYGEYLKNESQRLFQNIDKISSQFEMMKNEIESQIKIGYVAAIMHSILPEILFRFKQIYPRINTYLFELDNESQIKALKSGEINIGFLRTPVNDRDLSFERIHKDHYLLIMSREHKFSKIDKNDLMKFKNEPLITFSKTCVPLNGVKNICKKIGYTPNIIHETNQIHSILRLVDSNMGYAIVPSTVLKGYDLNLKSISLAMYNEYIDLFIGYKSSNPLKVCSNFIEIIKK